MAPAQVICPAQNILPPPPRLIARFCHRLWRWVTGHVIAVWCTSLFAWHMHLSRLERMHNSEGSIMASLSSSILNRKRHWVVCVQKLKRCNFWLSLHWDVVGWFADRYSNLKRVCSTTPPQTSLLCGSYENTDRRNPAEWHVTCMYEWHVYMLLIDRSKMRDHRMKTCRWRGRTRGLRPVSNQSRFQRLPGQTTRILLF